MSKQRALVMTLVAKSLKGDSRSITTLLNMMARALGFADTADDVERPLDANEQAVMAVLEARLQRKAAPATKPEGLPDESGSQPEVECRIPHFLAGLKKSGRRHNVESSYQNPRRRLRGQRSRALARSGRIECRSGRKVFSHRDRNCAQAALFSAISSKLSEFD